jgi:hypothetical protein
VPIPEANQVDKPWGYEIWWVQTPDYFGKSLHVVASQALSLQFAPTKGRDPPTLAVSSSLRPEARPTDHRGDRPELRLIAELWTRDTEGLSESWMDHEAAVTLLDGVG